MKPINNATVLVTGGSKGIGLAIAEEFAAQGHDLILVARGLEELERAAQRIRDSAQVNVLTFAIDLSETHAPEHLFEQVKASSVSVDVLVNNAGVGMTGDFAKSDYLKMTRMLQLNILALSQLTHLFLQPMLERNHGRILNIGSLVAYFAGTPSWAAYGASKHYVLSFSKGLARELKGSGVTVTVVSPGTTATDFVKTADATDMRAYQSIDGPSVKEIAKVAYKACQKGEVSVIPGGTNKILAYLGELHPRAIAFEVFAYLSQKKK
ncbi:MAG: SDR family oxidoreductase [Candidatus Thiodiazotropha sp. (ex Myrtea spinifera)]|nr:SDR family oxidoreductase [Candidatus Thiodiazotropha sp. (ex Myrtea spinifera)]